ncbi:MAG TPA: chemotaxis protein CheB [Methylomirabilota bacterium]|nr:chemotaxis protein CheB [Methylomirabilota bacterium]
MPTTQVKDGTAVQPDHVDVIPPNHSLTISGGVLRLGARGNTDGPHLPIDTFLASLADDQGAQAIGVVLSGTGSDGAVGLRDQERGGRDLRPGRAVGAARRWPGAGWSPGDLPDPARARRARRWCRPAPRVGFTLRGLQRVDTLRGGHYA